MSISTLMKKLSIATTGATFLGLGTLAPAPAKAITFNFSNTVFNVAVEGTITVNDDLLAQVIAAGPSDGFDPGIPDAVEFLEFSLDGTTIFSGIPSTSSILRPRGVFGPLEGSFLIFSGRDQYLGNSFQINLGLPAERCLQENCEGVVQFGGFALFDIFFDPENPFDQFGPFGPISLEPAIAKSVPEPSAAIAFGLIAAAILIPKRKALFLGRQ